MRTFLRYLRGQRPAALLAAAFALLFVCFCWLAGMERGTLLYGLLLWAALCALALGLGFARFVRQHEALKAVCARLLAGGEEDCLPAPGGALEEDYQALLKLLLEDRDKLRRETARRFRETEDTFTLWAHQIKNPLAAMGLILQQGEPLSLSELEQELFETEQYVDMALNYLRVSGEGTDYVFRRCGLDGIIRRTVKKFAPQFIRRKISLCYEGTEASVLTDEKWLTFVLEQLLSNALKYTPKGQISITASEERLTVADTGIGIAPEDLPRIFEKGYTGYNGRQNKKSTGMGLWLCKTVTDRLGHELEIRSVPGKGTQAVILFHAREEEPLP